MSFVRSLLARSALFLAAVVHASAQITCNPKYFNQPQWTCDICGDWEVGGAPIGCQPYNATFDDLPVGYLGNQNYQGTAWLGFAVVNDTGRALQPASLPHYAYLRATQRGFLNLTRNDYPYSYGGGLYSLHYGCTAAGQPDSPVACRVAFEAVCINSNGGNLTASSTILEYTPHGPNNASLAFANQIGPPSTGSGLWWCYNFNVLALDVEYPEEVDLYIDEVLHSDWVQTNF